MNLNSCCGGKSPGARGRASIASTAAAVTSAPAVTTSPITGTACARIGAAVIAGMAVAPEPAVTAAFAAGIGAGRTIGARSTALIFAALVSQHDPANKSRAGDNDARQ
jgi:hypothetical protein